VEGRKVRSALIAALVVVTAACARPISTTQQPPPPTPIPSPSPTPTTPLALKATAPFHNGEVGVAYASVGLSATGGVQPYTWTISDGQLPAGLTLASDGTVSGTPTSAGTFAFTVQVVDAGSSTATIPGSVPIAAALSASLIPDCATQCSVELGCTSVCGVFGEVSGGISPYSYALTSGQLPSGTSLSGLTLNGNFVGSSGFLKFSVQVTDSIGATATVTPTFWLYDHISLASDTATCYPMIFTPCSLQLAISGGVPGGNPSVSVAAVAAAGQGCYPASPTPLPAYSLTVSGGYVNLNIPRPGNGYGGIWTLVLTDHTLCASGTECTSPGATVKIGIYCT
jgi:hypothetical protein